MIKLRLLSAASAVAVAIAFAAPAQAYDAVNWTWDETTITGFYSAFDIDQDFVPWGLTQTERLQVMAGNMTAFADGSYATYTVPGENGSSAAPPVYIYNNLYPTQTIDQHALNGGESEGGDRYGYGYYGYGYGNGGDGGDFDQKIRQYAANYANQYNTVNIYLDDSYGYVPALDALTQLAKVEISASAISNVATIDSEHMSMVHDGQVAFGSFNPVQGGVYDETQDQAAMASNALVNWIGMDLGYSWGSEDDMYGSSGNRNFDIEMLAWTAAQYGLIDKGYNTAVALGDYISNAQADVSATAAANIHTVSVTPVNQPYPDYYGNVVTDNIAIVDLNQFGYQDTYAVASATYHNVSGFKNLGMLEAPVLKVSASALGNVSTVTNKFGGSAD